MPRGNETVSVREHGRDLYVATIKLHGMFAAQSKYLKHFPTLEKKRSYTEGKQMVDWQVHRDIHSIGNLKMEGGGLTKQ